MSAVEWFDDIVLGARCKSETVQITETDIKPYIKLDKNGRIPGCPSGGKYTIGKLGENPTCSLGTNVILPHVLP